MRFVVVGYYSESYEIFCGSVEAETELDAFAVVAATEKSVEIVAANFYSPGPDCPLDSGVWAAWLTPAC